jgi:hypothetical protein
MGERGGGGEWRGLGWAGFYGQRKPFFTVKRNLMDYSRSHDYYFLVQEIDFCRSLQEKMIG